MSAFDHWTAAWDAGRLRDHAAANLSAFERHPPSRAVAKRAAVACLITEDDAGTPCFVLTRRSSKLSSHKGQWALPGGRLDDGESVVEAALREVEEEVGVTVPEAEVLGRLDDYVTRSGYCIAPVVAWIGRKPDFVLNPAEVQELHLIPLRDLDREDSPQFVTIPESDRPVIRMPIMDNKIHAPTAAVLYQFRDVALHGRETRVAHYEQPVFAWK
ncbi:MAG: NUDIX hydrolase [Minwuia sp.]|uniref:NUDIX hydrolase n=1 Tax=Minwuia sp. TaxID=2493630 RepID=UPI003A8C1A78